jgi:tripartite-type tricarboxylate transporter receptor subunit TctC
MSTWQKLLLTGFIGTYAGIALAQVPLKDYPAKPIRIITGGAGTFHDIATRQLGQRLSERWRQPVVVENQPAAALTIGSGIAARATPDGYTLLMSDRSALSVAPSLYKSLAYDPIKDFSPITLAARAPSVLVAHPSVPASTLREFVDYASRQSGQINFAAGGVGTAGHIGNELFKNLTGLNIINIHYKGGGPSTLAVIGGEVKAGVLLMANVLPHVKSGKLKAYAVTSKKRFEGAPDIPSATEAGLPGLESEFWLGLLAPVRVPMTLIGRLNSEITALLRTADLHAELLKQGAESAYSTPEQFATLIASETARWGKVIKDAGIKPE